MPINNQHPKHMRKYISKLHKIGGAHLQYDKNKYMQGLNKKKMKTVGVADYTTLSPHMHFYMQKVSKFNTPKK